MQDYRVDGPGWNSEDEALERPVALLFHLLSACRAGQAGSHWALRRALHRRGIYRGAAASGLPRLSFWRRLAQAAGLLNESSPPRPTVVAPEWLALPPLDRLRWLVRSWEKMPGRVRRSGRRELLQHLAAQDGVPPWLQSELKALQAMGICRDGQLGAWGEALFRNGPLPAGSPALPWRLEGDHLVAPYPADWRALWELEACLQPDGPQRYPLDAAALQRAVQAAGGERLAGILERGLARPLPEELARRLAAGPALRVLHGLVLEFCRPGLLSKLRRKRAWREQLLHLLSPRHVLLPDSLSAGILSRLVRAGLLAEQQAEAAKQEQGLAAPEPLPTAALRAGAPARRLPLKLQRTEQVYVYVLALVGRDLPGLELAPPPELIRRLKLGLPPEQAQAAQRRAQRALQALAGKPRQAPADQGGPLPTPAPDLLKVIQRAIEREETLDVLYQAAGREQPELRRIAPLLLERRGTRHYLLAYCHTRRANRTFRLDRLELLEDGGPEPAGVDRPA